MNRVQFLTVTILSGVVALFIVLEIFVSLSLNAKEKELSAANAALQEGQSDFQRLQQIASRAAQLSANDDQLRQLLARNNIQVSANTNGAPASPAPSSGAAPATH